MTLELIMAEIADLEREIAQCPEGSITTKKIKDKDYFYHRVNSNGKRTEKYISFDEVSNLRVQIEKRKALEKKMKSLKKQIPFVDNKINHFRTMVRLHERLKMQVTSSRNFKKRRCFSVLEQYIYSNQNEKVCIIYGLRRTGKTTMIRQLLEEMDASVFEKSAYIQVSTKDTIQDVNHDLKLLEEQGFQYVFIDEVTLLEDFVESAALFSDIYATSGMKIVLSGTDSLGFAFTKEEQLYDRCIFVHTTFIPYKEFEDVLGIKGIDEYIRYGGTMSLSGTDYNGPFKDSKSANEYVDTAIAKNIQHSLKLYEYGGHFRGLLDLYEEGQLTNVINRVVENMNHRFTKAVVESSSKSNDLSLTSANLLRDQKKAIDLKEHLDVDSVTNGLMQILEILNREEQTIEVEKSHLSQIKEYLMILDIIMEIDLESLPNVSKSKMIVITQPGIRYAQANALVERMLMDSKFNTLSIQERNRILLRLLNEIKGRMLEEIVLLETKIANPSKKVFKLQFSIGEFDMVVFDPKELNCKIYEIKYNHNVDQNQIRHLINKEKCEMTSHRYGQIIEKSVLYRGEEKMVNGIHYQNVEEYLKSLYD